nr:hypothetical protein [Tanacetum cinerariifolium]
MKRFLRLVRDEMVSHEVERIFLEMKRFLRWVQDEMVSHEVESKKWRRLLLHWIFNAFGVLIDGREEDFFPRNDGRGSSMVQKSGIQCYNCKEFRHVARECQKPKRVKDAAYHREKMLLCKQKEAGIQLNAEQADWKDDTNDESDDQELEAHYVTPPKMCVAVEY